MAAGINEQVLRYLVPIVTLVVVLGRSVTTFAAAGPQPTDVHCCCPTPSTCKCHHGKSGSDTSMKRCDGGERWVSLELETAIVPVRASAIVFTELTRLTVHVLVTLSDDRVIIPEKPPF